MIERTLLLLKPDAIQRGLIGRMITRFEEKGFRIVGMKMLKLSRETAKEHYSHLLDKPFYPGLEEFMTSHPIITMVVEGQECVEVVRKMVGATNARKADAGTIRGDYSLSTGRNTIHASDSPETAKKEIARFFSDDELFDYELRVFEYLYAEDERE